jgi:DNA-binding NarL/FixJ family response regulator
MRVLCVTRHPILSEHLCRFFEQFDLAAVPCVGVPRARSLVPAYDPDLVLCDYDLLTPSELAQWRADAAARVVPIVAVSMTRRPSEVRLVEATGVVGFLYLPTTSPSVARHLLASLRRRRDGVASPNQLPWSGTASAARIR